MSLFFLPTFLHIRKHFLKINQVGLVWDWEIWGWPARPSKGLPWATLAYKTRVMPCTHLTKVLWRLIMACKGLWRWNVLVMEINGLRRKAFFKSSFVPFSLAVLAFKEPRMSSEVRVTSPRLLWEARVESRLPWTTYRCDPSLLLSNLNPCSISLPAELSWFKIH